MKTILTDLLPPMLPRMDQSQKHYVYNALDVTIPHEIVDTLQVEETPATKRIYGFEMRGQGAAMTMMLRGTRIDPLEKRKGIKRLRALIRTTRIAINDDVSDVWHELEVPKPIGWCKEVNEKTGKRRRHKWGGDTDVSKKCVFCDKSRLQPKKFNPNSTQQTAKLLYECLGLRKKYNREGKLTSDKHALEKLTRAYPQHSGLFNSIEIYRGLLKQLNILEKRLSPDGRWRSSFNVGATVDARWSSSSNCFTDGDNMQNILRDLRVMFVPDIGMDMVYYDLEQAESKCVAYLAGDAAYISAHDDHNVHVYCGREVFWPDLLDWTGDDEEDKRMMKGTNVPWDPSKTTTYYDASKRNQHGSNYYMTVYGLAFNSKMPVRVAEEVMGRYFDHFPMIRAWHDVCRERLLTTKTMTNPLGRERQFFGREWEDGTLRKYIASEPQSTIAEILNTALILIWEELDPDKLQILQQGHDAILAQVFKNDHSCLARMEELMNVPVPILGIDGIERTMTIGVEGAIGRNWGEIS